MLDIKGNEIEIGDTVLFENGKTSGVIIHVLEDPRDLEFWNLNEKGIMLESMTFGMIFLPISCFIDHEVQIGSDGQVANGDKH